MRTITTTLFVRFAALLSVVLLVSTSEAVMLTSVNQLDLTGVTKAYNFITSADSTFDIGGVTFTNHDWRNQLAFDDLTATVPGTLSGAPLSAPAISLGGSVADQANLSSLLNSTNFSATTTDPITLSIAVPDGEYYVQYMAGTGGSRSNEFVDAGPPEVSFGSFVGSGNFLLAGTAYATGGTGLELRVDPFPGADSRPIISGLIVSFVPPPVPEPSSFLLLGLGAFGLVRHTRRRRRRA